MSTKKFPPATHLPGHEPLARRLLELGAYPPCHGRDAFTSEDADERAEAAQACQWCPVAPECAEAGELERFGVWGGVDRSQAPPSRRKAAA